MHVEIIKSAEASTHELDLLHQLYRLRAKVFAGRLSWDVEVSDEEERDDYDLLGPTYIGVIGTNGTIVGGARLLPATGPTMLTHTFPFLLDEGRGIQNPGATVESSRFCVDTGASEDLSATGRNEVTHALFAAIIEWSLANSFIHIVTVTDVRFERILRRAGWPLERLGPPQAVGNTRAIAGTLPADLVSFKRVKPAGYTTLFPQQSAAA